MVVIGMPLARRTITARVLSGRRSYDTLGLFADYRVRYLSRA
jgi:hypothetical protein